MSGAMRLRHQLPVLIWLVLIWILLWGTWSWANLLSGILVAVVVTNVLPLPAVIAGARLRPVPLLRFAGYFLKDLAVSSAQVAWQTIRPGGMNQGAIIAVQLRTDSDLLLTLIAESLTLVPGSIVLDLDRPRRTLGIHLLNAADADDVERQRAGVFTTEERIVRAFGTREDIARLESGEPVGEPAAGTDRAEAGR
ncbi:Na+/H+ antiporter subunit E [Modestobacter sp. VKM Ac-2977]|uniref:Na+/H+ antiporter subunit E n=1 Tax=Modestobacter sp. VKM Ac-2977 TaxID=3004131 RepID=UPI0022AA4DC8|nr:Na+/H+ antiporter subunit E [Modestobacter sp. VKM Ac-2977]MCZ2818805.1 Na+/H+ antiporter subunit E [Modestobacter sp. VKM Ac-2977]